MSPLIADKTLAILAAWAIPEKDRIDGYLEAPPEVISAAHYSH